LRRGVRSERQRLDALGARLMPALGRKLAQLQSDVARRTVPVPDVTRSVERLDVLARRLSERAGRDHDARVARLDGLDRLRETLGYKETLRRGYAVMRGDGAVVSDVAGAKAAGSLEVEFADGSVAVGKAT